MTHHYPAVSGVSPTAFQTAELAEKVSHEIAEAKQQDKHPNIEDLKSNKN